MFSDKFTRIRSVQKISTKSNDKILQLEKELDAHSNDVHFLLDLYGCYVEVSNTEKKIECLEKISNLKPND